MAVQTENNLAISINPSSSQTHFWVCSGPFFDTSLLVLPANQNESADNLSSVKLYDSDGALINEISVQFAAGTVGVVELEPLMSACKFESGLKYAHVEITSPNGAKHMCRLHSRESASLMGEPLMISSTRRVFFPLVFSRDRYSLLCLVNCGSEIATVRGRFFCRSRSPEMVWSVPPNGARTVCLATEFADYLELEDEAEEIQAYIRLGLRGDFLVGAQIIERARGPKEGSIFTVFS